MKKALMILFSASLILLALHAGEAAQAQEKAAKKQQSAAKKSTKTAAAAPAPQAAEKPEPVYDLGSIVVKGEDGSSIKDPARKKIAYLTKDSLAGKGPLEKKTAAEFEAPDAAAPGACGESVASGSKYSFESMAGTYSETETTGKAEYDRKDPAAGLATKSSVTITGKESGGYRFKSDFRDLKADIGYEADEKGAVTKADLKISDGTRSLPGFDAFPNGYADSDIRSVGFAGGYSDRDGRFTAGFDNVSRKIRVPSSAVADRYDSALFSLGYARDMVFENNPVTLELKVKNDSLDVRSAQASSDSSTLLSLNVERPVSDRVMVQVAPEIAKNGGNGARAGGVASATVKDGADIRYTVSAGRQARKYDSGKFLFPDENTLVWAQDAAGSNRFADNAYEKDERFAELAGEAGLSCGTKVRASYRQSKIDGLLYLSDLNQRDARFTFAGFAPGAKSKRFALRLEHPLDGGFAADISAASTSVTDSVSDLAPYIPKNEYSIGLKYDGKKGYSGKITNNVVGKMDTARAAAANAGVPARSTLDLEVAKRFSENGKVAFRAGNLLDKELYLRPGYAYRGRSFAIGLGYSY